MANKRRAFTLTECVISFSLMAILAGIIIFSMNTAAKSPKAEAERLAAYLSGLSFRADRIQLGVDVDFDGDNISVLWAGKFKDSRESFDADDNFRYEPHLNSGNLSSVNAKKWTYCRKDYPYGARISASDSIARYSTNNKGHKYIEIIGKDDPGTPYYVVITTGSIAQ